MKEKLSRVLAFLLTLAFIGSFANATMAAEVPRITKEDLKAMMGDPNVVIIDVRIGRDWKASELKIKGAVREEPEEVKSWAGRYDKDKTYVLYCA